MCVCVCVGWGVGVGGGGTPKATIVISRMILLEELLSWAEV